MIVGSPKKNYNDIENDGQIGLFEFRASGGLQTVVGPSVHPTGGIYDRIEPDQFATVTQLELTESCERLQLAILEKRGHSLPPEPVRTCDSETRDDAPGTIYNQQATPESVHELLTRHGFQATSRNGSRDTYRHPNATQSTSGFYRFDEKRYVNFSPNCLGGISGTAGTYSPFALYAYLECQGDFKAAAVELGDKGYGRTVTDKDIEWGVALANNTASRQERERITSLAEVEPDAEEVHQDIPRELWDIEGAIGDSCRWMLSSAMVYQPNFALWSTISMLASVMGPKLAVSKLRSGEQLYENAASFYIFLLGESSSGKGVYRKRVELAMKSAGLKLHGQRVSAPRPFLRIFDEAGTDGNNWLYARDEIGKFFGQMADNKILREVQELMLDMWPEPLGEHGMYYSDKKNDIIVSQPCPVVLGTGIAKGVFESIGTSADSDGFISRSQFVFGADDPPRNTSESQLPLPIDLTEWLKHYYQFRASSGGNLENLDGFSTRHMQLSDNAEAAFKTYAAEKIAQERSAEGIVKACANRSAQNALRYALVHACSITMVPDIEGVEVESMNWGIAVAEFVLQTLERRQRGIIVGENEDRISRYCERAIGHIQKAGGSITIGRLRDRMRLKNRIHEREMRLSLENAGDIRVETSVNGAEVWCLTKLVSN
jgi:hypothetical protein